MCWYYSLDQVSSIVAIHISDLGGGGGGARTGRRDREEGQQDREEGQQDRGRDSIQLHTPVVLLRVNVAVN